MVERGFDWLREVSCSAISGGCDVLPSCSRGLVILQPAVELSPSGPRLSDVTRLSDDPQCCWRPPRIRLPSRKVLVCRRYFRFFRQVADKSPPRAEGSHPNPCLPLRVKPFLMERIRFGLG